MLLKPHILQNLSIEQSAMNYKNYDNPFYGDIDEDDDIFAIATADLAHVPQEQSSHSLSNAIQDNDGLSFLDNIVQIDDLSCLMDDEEKKVEDSFSVKILGDYKYHQDMNFQLSPATSPVRPYKNEDSIFLFNPHTVHEDDATLLQCSKNIPIQHPQTPKTMILPFSSPGGLYTNYQYHPSNINVTTTPSNANRSGIGKVSFVIQSGRVTSESPAIHSANTCSTDPSNIPRFIKPSSARRRLDFHDPNLVTRSNSITSITNNMDSLQRSKINDITRRPLSENQQSIPITPVQRSGKENFHASLNQTIDSIDKKRRYSIPKDLEPMELLPMKRRPKEYEKFLLDLLNNEEAEDDDEDDIYRVASDEPEDDLKTIKKDPIVRVSDREFVALLDDYTDAFASEHHINSTDIKSTNLQSYQMESHISLLNPFTIEQLNTLRDQMAKHFQLLVQLFGLSIEISGGDSVAKAALDLLFDLKCRADKGVASIGSLLIVDSVIPVPLHLSSIHHYHTSDTTLPLSFYSLSYSGFDKLELFRPIYTILAHQLECRKSLEIQCKSVMYQDDMINDVQHILPQSAARCSYDGPAFILPFKLKHNHVSSSGNHNHIILPARLETILEIFKNDFSPDFDLYFLQECQQHRVKFVDAEDRLLLKGLKRFGCSSWDQIQQYYLPGKTQRQIAIRYKNLISRTAPINPIKDFYFEQFLPLTFAEKELLYHGMSKYRGNFQQISRELLPNRPAAILKRFWTEKSHAYVPQKNPSQSPYPSSRMTPYSHVLIAPATPSTYGQRSINPE